jgi:hypothetical protein
MYTYTQTYIRTYITHTHTHTHMQHWLRWWSDNAPVLNSNIPSDLDQDMVILRFSSFSSVPLSTLRVSTLSRTWTLPLEWFLIHHSKTILPLTLYNQILTASWNKPKRTRIYVCVCVCECARARMCVRLYACIYVCVQITHVGTHEKYVCNTSVCIHACPF